MSTDVLVRGTDRETRQPPVIGALGFVEAWRLVTSPAILLLVAFHMVTLAADTVTRGDGSHGLLDHASIAANFATFSLLLLGPFTFVATHLAATSGRRSGSTRQLGAAPVAQRRRDLGLCLAVLLGPALLALAVATVSASLSGGLRLERALFNADTAGPWSWTDVLQAPAIVLGAGILGIVVARWLPIPGSLLLGFVGMILATLWFIAPEGATAIRTYFAPYVAIPWWVALPWKNWGSQTWHLAYLFALSALGVCAVALRQPERRGRWLAVGAVAVAAVVAAGLLQLPPWALR